MIRAASYNSSVSDSIRRGQKLYGATTEQQLRPTMKETVSTWISSIVNQHSCSSRWSSLFSSTLSPSNDDDDEIVPSIEGHYVISHPDFLRMDGLDIDNEKSSLLHSSRWWA